MIVTLGARAWDNAATAPGDRGLMFGEVGAWMVATATPATLRHQRRPERSRLRHLIERWRDRGGN